MERGSGGEAETSQVADRAFERLSFRFTCELENHGRSATTAKVYGYTLGKFHRWTEGCGIKFLALTREDAEQWLGELRTSKQKRASIRTTFTVVRKWYRWMVALGIVERDPFAAMSGIKVPETLQPVLDIPQVERFVKACETLRETAMVETLYSSGVRRAAFLGMRLPDLNLGAGLVKVRTKGGREMYGLLSSKSIAAITAWLPLRDAYPCLKRAPTDLLWIGRNGPVSPTQLAGILQAIASRAGLGRVTPHVFRRTFATALTDQGVDIGEVSKLMGHDHIASTQCYTKYSTARLLDAWRKLPRR